MSCSQDPGPDALLTNWSGNVAYRAHSRAQPADLQELARLLRAAPQAKALGTRHCFSEIADTDGQHLSLSAMDAIGPIDPQRKTVTLAGGVRYGELGSYLQHHGFALANLASLPHISVAGACTTATHGSGVRHGCLATQVRSLEFLDADGEVITFSRDDPDDGFFGAVVHLGALGPVTRLELDIEPAFEVAQTVYLDLPLEAFIESPEDILAAAYSVSLFTDWQKPAFHQAWVKRRMDEAGKNERAYFGARSADTPCHPLSGHAAENCTAQLGAPGPWHQRLPHFRLDFTPSSGRELQSEYFVERHHAGAALQSLWPLRARIQPLVHVTELRAIAADSFWMSPCFQRHSLGIHFTWKPRVAEVSAVLPEIEAALEPFNPRPHWGKLSTLSPGIVARSYPRLEDFHALACRLDPNGKFSNPFLDRLFRHAG